MLDLSIVSRLAKSPGAYVALLGVMGSGHGWLSGQFTFHQATAVALGALLGAFVLDAILLLEAKLGLSPSVVEKAEAEVLAVVPHKLPDFVKVELVKLGIDPALVEQGFKAAMASAETPTPTPPASQPASTS